MADRPVPGWTLIVVSLSLGAAAAAAAARLGIVELAAWAAQPDVILGILAVNAALGAGRLIVSAHAWRSGGGRGWADVTFLAIVVIVPHALVGWAGWFARDTLLAVFAAPPALAVPIPAGTTTTSTTSTTSTTTPPTTSAAAAPAPTTAATTASTTTTSTTLPPTTTTTAPFEGQRLNLLILGGDAGPGRWGLRTDAILVGSVDTATGDAALFGLPRNFGGVTFSDGSPFPGRILNEVYAYGRDHADRFEGVDPGATAVKDVAEHITGLDIDYFLLVDLTGFGAVVDAFGGVTLTVPEAVYGPLYDPATGGYEMMRIEEGKQSLNGGEALAYARARLDSSDYVRMARQRCLLAAMVDGADPVGLVAGLPDLLQAVETHLTTDLPLELVPDLIRVAGNVSASDIRMIGFGPDWSTGRNSDGFHVPDIDRIRVAVQRTITEPADDPGVTTTSENCR